jgi:hypothetical protein
VEFAVSLSAVMNIKAVFHSRSGAKRRLARRLDDLPPLRIETGDSEAGAVGAAPR